MPPPLTPPATPSMSETANRHLLKPRYWPSIFGLWLLSQISKLPYRWQLAMGRQTGNVLRTLSARHRHIATTNIRLCFPDLAEEERKLMVQDHFKALGISLFEIGMSWWAADEALRPLLHIRGEEHLEAALSEGSGVLLLTAHFTTLEISARLMSMIHPIDVTYRTGDDDPIGQHLRGQRNKRYEQAIPKDNVRAVLRRLRENKIIWYAPDQSFGGKNRVYADFFGVPAASNPATARFSHISGAKVVPFCCIRLPRDSGYELVFQPALENFPTDDLVADTQRINTVFESLIRQAPEQYLWVHKRFKHPPPGGEEPY